MAPDNVRELARPPGEAKAVPTHHGGGVLLEKGLFSEIGGYCPDYTGWGCDDHDLLHKLASRREIVQAWQADPAMTCLHFEHSHDYVGTDMYASRALLARRRAMGADAMIRADRHSAVSRDDP
jgi:predicted glycosyltransferase involved in capsule biosynthesis